VRPLVIARRGASSLEVENSLAAFRRAVTMGADGIELDVHATADGALVVVHDDVLGGRPIRELTLPQVQAHRLKNGEPLPTLPDALETIGGDTTVFVEVKALPPSSDGLLLTALRAGPTPARYHVHSFDHRIIWRLGKIDKKRVYGVLSCSYPVDPLEMIEAARAKELWQHDSLLDEELVRAAHSKGCRVYAWTVDDPARMKELRGLGVDGVCTNRPDVARKALA